MDIPPAVKLAHDDKMPCCATCVKLPHEQACFCGTGDAAEHDCYVALAGQSLCDNEQLPPGLLEGPNAPEKLFIHAADSLEAGLMAVPVHPDVKKRFLLEEDMPAVGGTVSGPADGNHFGEGSPVKLVGKPQGPGRNALAAGEESQGGPGDGGPDLARGTSGKGPQGGDLLGEDGERGRGTEGPGQKRSSSRAAADRQSSRGRSRGPGGRACAGGRSMSAGARSIPPHGWKGEPMVFIGARTAKGKPLSLVLDHACCQKSCSMLNWCFG
jgi:hypothetical protein